MVAGDPSQTTPVQITHVFFVSCCCTQIGCVEQHKNEENVCNLYWCSMAIITSSRYRASR